MHIFWVGMHFFLNFNFLVTSCRNLPHLTGFVFSFIIILIERRNKYGRLAKT